MMSDWRQRNKTFFGVLEVERNVMFLILMLIVLVAALNIVSGLIMLVKDKSADIAILRTMGATRGAIMRIFLITGAAIGFVGTLAGFLLGLVISLNVENLRALIPPHRRKPVSGRVLLPQQPAIRGRPAGGRHHRADGAHAVAARDTVSLLARGPARSGRGAALRVSDACRDSYPDPVLYVCQVERRFREGEGTLDILWARSRHLAGPIRRVDCAFGHGQVDPAADRRPAGKTGRRRGLRHLAWDRDAFRRRADSPFRRHEIGFVYQAHHLLPEFTALENVMMPQLIRGLSRADAAERARDSSAISGSGAPEAPALGALRRRTAARRIARAVANAPRILLADEPTGNLDPHTSSHVFDTLTPLARKPVSPLCRDAQPRSRGTMDRRVTLRDGQVVELP